MKPNPECDLCPLHKTARKVCIPGRQLGEGEPQVMIVGQAPGQQEDLEGRCFIGPAGQLLKQAIKEYELKPVWLTNAAKCFPPGDRDPTTKEIAACRPYLDSEIAEKRPKYVVALGNIALKALTGRVGITQVSGTVVGEVNGSKIFALIHPSYVLRYPHNLSKFEADCKELSWLVSPDGKPDEPSVEEVTPKQWDEVMRLTGGPVAWDLETNGKFKKDGGRMRTVAVSDGKATFWMNIEKHGDQAKKRLREFLLSDIEKAAHNIAFEYKWSLDEFGISPRKFNRDTMVMHFLLNENSAHGLEVVASEMLGAPKWDTMADYDWDWEGVDAQILGRYNGYDAYWTAKLNDHMWAKMDDSLRGLYNLISLPFMKLCARFERRGIKIDADWCKTADQCYAGQMEVIEAEMYGNSEFKWFVRLIKNEKKKLNLNSGDQMRRLFFQVMKLPVGDRTDGGKPSVKESALERLREKHDLVDDYLKWKTRQTLRNNYLQKFPRFADEDGLIHAHFNPAHVVTGRLSVTKPPLQAPPEDVLVRGMFISRFDGGMLASLDYKQLEVRLVASESEEKTLMKAIMDGEDLHDLTASFVFGKDFTKRQRSIAKRINFGMVFGITSYTLANEFAIAADEADRILRNFQRAYPRIYQWMRRQHEFVKEYAWIGNRFGRKRRMPGIKGADHWETERMLRQAGNFPIASLGADTTNLACILVDKWLRKEKKKSLLVHQVHDSLILDVHRDERDDVPGRCVTIMEEDVTSRCPWLRVPLKVDLTLTERWGGATEVK